MFFVVRGRGAGFSVQSHPRSGYTSGLLAWQYTVADSREKTVAFILSHGHAGSTLLGNVLGAHPAALHLGEIVNPLQRERAVRCYVCGDQSCPIWGGAVEPEFVLRCYDSFRRATAPKPFFETLMARFRRQPPREYTTGPGELFVRLFAQLPGVDVIVDGSKNPQWAEWNRRSGAFRSRYIFLRRDLRALVASRVRRGYALPKAVRATRKKIEKLLAFERRSAGVLPSYLLRYETLVTEPRRECEALCDFLGIPFSDRMLNYFAHVQHIFGGNVAPTVESLRYHGKTAPDVGKSQGFPKGGADSEYYGEQPGFKLDERWKTQFSEQEMSMIERELGSLNRQLGYK